MSKNWWGIWQLGMCLCVCVYVRPCVCVWLYVHMYMHIRMCMYVCYVSECIRTYIFMYVYIFVYIHVSVFLWTCVCMYHMHVWPKICFTIVTMVMIVCHSKHYIMKPHISLIHILYSAIIWQGKTLVNLVIWQPFTNILPTSVFLTHKIFYRCLV